VATKAPQERHWARVGFDVNFGSSMGTVGGAEAVKKNGHIG